MESTCGFFNVRRPLKLKKIEVGGQRDFVDYRNVPISIGTILSRKMATLHELDTVYGTQDCYDLMEIIIIDSYNKIISMED